MAYSHYMEQGRVPNEIDSMNMEDYLKILGWRAWMKKGQEDPPHKHIEDFI